MGASSFVIRLDFDELGEVARAWDLDFRQLNRGGFRGAMVQAGAAEIMLSRIRLAGVLHQAGSAPEGFRTFAIAMGTDIDLCWRGNVVGSNQLLVFPSNRELDSASRPRHTCMPNACTAFAGSCDPQPAVR